MLQSNSRFSYLDGEEYIWVPTRKVLINEQIRLKDVPLFGYIKSSVATPPTKLHSHANTIEFTYISRGQQRFCTRDNDYQIYGGELFVMPADVLHSTGVTPVEKQEMFWFQINYEDAIDFLGLTPNNTSILIDKLRSLPIFKFKVESGIKKLFIEALENLAQDEPTLRLKALSNIHQILLEVVTAGNKASVAVSTEISRAVKYLDEHLCDDISLELLAEISYLSLSRFKERFRFEIGITPREYVNFKKVEHSKILLQKTDDTNNITKIAMALGFSSSSYFSVVFHKFTAMTPTEYLIAQRSLKK